MANGNDKEGTTQTIEAPTTTPVVVAPVKDDNLPTIRASNTGPMAGYLDRTRFEQAWSVAKLLASSDLVPAHFKGKPANCFIAVQLADRLDMDPFMVIQNTYIVHGRPGFEGKFIIALLNSSGLFKDPLDFDFEGKPLTPEWKIRVTAERKNTGKVCVCEFSYQTAIAEGWVSNNAKWKSMAEQMMCYRGAAFFARRFCPERIMGVQTVEELIDIEPVHVSELRNPGLPPDVQPTGKTRIEEVKDRLKANALTQQEAERLEQAVYGDQIPQSILKKVEGPVAIDQIGSEPKQEPVAGEETQQPSKTAVQPPLTGDGSAAPAQEMNDEQFRIHVGESLMKVFKAQRVLRLYLDEAIFGKGGFKNKDISREDLEYGLNLVNFCAKLIADGEFLRPGDTPGIDVLVKYARENL